MITFIRNIQNIQDPKTGKYVTNRAISTELDDGLGCHTVKYTITDDESDYQNEQESQYMNKISTWKIDNTL